MTEPEIFATWKREPVEILMTAMPCWVATIEPALLILPLNVIFEAPPSTRMPVAAVIVPAPALVMPPLNVNTATSEMPTRHKSCPSW